MSKVEPITKKVTKMVETTIEEVTGYTLTISKKDAERLIVLLGHEVRAKNSNFQLAHIYTKLKKAGVTYGDHSIETFGNNWSFIS